LYNLGLWRAVDYLDSLSAEAHPLGHCHQQVCGDVRLQHAKRPFRATFTGRCWCFLVLHLVSLRFFFIVAGP
jgi:hypothetical protein